MEKKSQIRVTFMFILLLFFIFGLCALFTVLIGGQVYENIIDRGEDSFTRTIALSYIANKVRQGDTAGQISVRDNVLCIEESFGGNTYVTYIGSTDGNLAELYTNADSGLSIEDGNVIIRGTVVEFSEPFPGVIAATIDGETLYIAARSGGGQ